MIKVVTGDRRQNARYAMIVVNVMARPESHLRRESFIWPLVGSIC